MFPDAFGDLVLDLAAKALAGSLDLTAQLFGRRSGYDSLNVLEERAPLERHEKYEIREGK